MLPALVHDTLDLVLDYHEQLAASLNAAGTHGAPVPEVTSLASYAADKFVVLCDEARGSGEAYPDLSNSEHSEAQASVTAVRGAAAAQQPQPSACSAALDGRPEAEVRVHKHELRVDPGSQKENLPNVL